MAGRPKKQPAKRARKTPPKRRETRAKGERIRWGAIQGEYIRGSDSLDQLAAAHNVNATRLRHRAADENWRLRREAFRAAVQEVTTNDVFKGKRNLFRRFAMQALEECFEHLQELVERRRAGGFSKTSEHLSHAKAVDAVVDRFARLAGHELLDAGTVRKLVFAYLPDDAKEVVDGSG